QRVRTGQAVPLGGEDLSGCLGPVHSVPSLNVSCGTVSEGHRPLEVDAGGVLWFWAGSWAGCRSGGRRFLPRGPFWWSLGRGAGLLAGVEGEADSFPPAGDRMRPFPG